MVKQVRTVAICLASTEIWLIVFLAATSVIFARALPLVVGIAGLFWVLRWLASGRPTVRTRADWAIALLVLMSLVSLWVTALPETTRPQVYRLLTGVALYYAIVNWATSITRLRLLVIGTMLAGLLLAVSAPVSVTWLDSGKLPFISHSLYAHFTPLVSDTVNPNVMAGALVILLPTPLAALLFGWQQLSKLTRGLAGVTALFMSGILILTQSRGGLMALAAVLLVMALLRWRRGWLLLLASAIPGAIALQLLGAGVVLNALTTNNSFGGIENRLEIWSRAWYMIQEFPFTGIGMGSFQEVTDMLYPLFLSPSGIPHAHNLFLQVAVDLGIPGLIAWLAILMLVSTTAWQIYSYGRAVGDNWLAGLGAGLLCSQVALAVHGLTDAVTWGMVRTAVVVWALWGLAVAGWNARVVGSEQRSSVHRRTEAARSVLGVVPGVVWIWRLVWSPALRGLLATRNRR